METHWTIPCDNVGTQATLHRSETAHATLIFGHGAGSRMDHPLTLELVTALQAAGLNVVTFNFLYRALGKGPPDRMPQLKACYTAVVDHVRAELQPETLWIGGHSMGGRVASMLTAEGFECDRLLLLSYPLHPAGKPQQLRTKHLPQIKVPTLCLNGTRDALCTRELMEAAERPGGWTMHWLEGADHGYAVLKRSGRTRDGVLNEITETVRAWATR